MKFIFMVTLLLLVACHAIAQWNPNGATTGNIYYNGGNVGIGESSPSSPLHVKSNINRTLRLDFIGLSEGNSYTWQSFSANSVEQWRIIGKENDNASLEFYNKSSVSRLSLLQNGNIGIGVSQPGAKLDVAQAGGGSGTNGALRLRAGNTNTYFGNNQIILSYDGGNDYSHAIKTRHDGGNATGNSIDFYVWKPGNSATTIGSNHVMSLNGGNVGIGTLSPETKLHLFHGGQTLKFLTGTNSSGYALNIGVNDNGVNFTNNSGIRGFNFFNNNGLLLALASNGNVGIGKTTPETLLDLGDLHFDNISAFPNEGSILEQSWGTYMVGDASNTSQRALRMGVSNDGFTRAEIHFDNGNRIDGTISFKTANNHTGAQTRMFVHGNGFVGMGTTVPTSNLHIVAPASANPINAMKIEVNSFSTTQNAINSSYFSVHDVGANSTPFIIRGSGFVGIGTSNPNQMLTVNGTIYGREVKVDLQVPGPDYVFEPTYQLPSLTEIENYIKANKHLPEVPSAKEMETNGINLSEMNMLLLKKVEELTLHLIRIEKENELQRKEINELKRREEK